MSSHSLRVGSSDGEAEASTVVIVMLGVYESVVSAGCGVEVVSIDAVVVSGSVLVVCVLYSSLR